MPERFRLALPAALLPVLAACVGGPAAVPLPPAQGQASAPPREAFRAPQVQRAQGLEGVIGSGASALTARFGKPRIDAVEGDARKLQFAGERCVLDIYLYPLREGTAPVATHVEARLRKGGEETRRNACIREIESGAARR